MDNAEEFDARGNRNRILSPFFEEPETTNPTPEQCRERLDKIYAKKQFSAVGFKFKFPNQTDNYPEILEALRARADALRVIYLFRMNQMKRGVSRQHLVSLLKSPTNKNLRGGNTNTDKPSAKILVDIQQLKSFFKRQARQRKWLSEILDDFPHRLEVTYEDLINHQVATSRRLLAFLNVDSAFELKTNLQKLTPDSLKDIVINYDELVQAFAGTEYERFLD